MRFFSDRLPGILEAHCLSYAPSFDVTEEVLDEARRNLIPGNEATTCLLRMAGKTLYVLSYADRKSSDI